MSTVVDTNRSVPYRVCITLRPRRRGLSWRRFTTIVSNIIRSWRTQRRFICRHVQQLRVLFTTYKYEYNNRTRYNIISTTETRNIERNAYFYWSSLTFGGTTRYNNNVRDATLNVISIIRNTGAAVRVSVLRSNCSAMGLRYHQLCSLWFHRINIETTWQVNTARFPVPHDRKTAAKSRPANSPSYWQRDLSVGPWWWRRRCACCYLQVALNIPARLYALLLCT